MRSPNMMDQFELARQLPIGPGHRQALSVAYDQWLSGITELPPGVALLALGSLGRSECSTGSDLDLMLIHDNKRDITAVADSLWYPIWDSGNRLDHSVRTVSELEKVARTDTKSAFNLIEARLIAGDRQLADRALHAFKSMWRTHRDHHLRQLEDLTQARWDLFGELSYALEPDLKEARGGLRDITVIRGLAYAQVADQPSLPVKEAGHTLMNVREALHRITGKSRDRLLQQDQQAVADLLGYAHTDDLFRAVALAGRMISYGSHLSWSMAAASRTPRSIRKPKRIVIADSILQQTDSQGTCITLTVDAPVADDPWLALRVMAAAVTADLPVADSTLRRLAATSDLDRQQVWPEPARQAWLTILGTGRKLVALWEAVDQNAIIGLFLPEWERVRSLPQHNSVHQYTVDRHLLETVACAQEFVHTVSRPDLLLMAALLHDIGKGLPGDHSLTSAELAAVIGERCGFNPDDVSALSTIVRHHLLLFDTATKRDIDDPVTVSLVAEAVHHSADIVDILRALTYADAIATGPGVWSEWKSDLVDKLVDNVKATLTGHEPAHTIVTPHQKELVTSGDEVRLVYEDNRVYISAPVSEHLLSVVAGVLALHKLDIISADIRAHQYHTVISCLVNPRFGSFVDLDTVLTNIRLALAGHIPLAERIAARTLSYTSGGQKNAVTQLPHIMWFTDQATEATICEVRTSDRPGLLFLLCSALESVAAQVKLARVSTLGSNVVDVFYLHGDYSTQAQRTRVEQSLLSALTPPSS